MDFVFSQAHRPLSRFSELWAKRVKEVTAERGCSQRDIAEAMGKSIQTISAPRRMRKAIGWSEVTRFCRLFGLSPQKSTELEHEWILERMTFGAIGAVAQATLDYLDECEASGKPPKRSDLRRIHVTTFRQAMEIQEGA